MSDALPEERVAFGFKHQPLRGKRLPTAVADDIEALIVGGTLPTGTMLPPERVLGDDYGVSRTVIREAMKRLERDGLVEILHGKGVRVSAKSAESVADAIEKYLLTTSSPVWALLELRRLVETGTASLAAKRRDDNDVVTLTGIIKEMRSSLDDPLRYVELDFELHRALSRATKNPLMEVVLEPFVRLLMESRRLGANARQAPRRSIDAHANIVDAIEAGDSIAARNAMSEHFDRVEQFLRETQGKRFGQTEQDPAPTGRIGNTR